MEDLTRYKINEGQGDLSKMTLAFNQFITALSEREDFSIYTDIENEIPISNHILVNAFKDDGGTWRQINSDSTSWSLVFDTATNQMYIYYAPVASDPIVWETRLSIDALSGLILPGTITVDGVTVTSFTSAGYVKNDASGILSGGNSIAGVLSWTEIAADTVAETSKGYVCNNISELTVTLPALAAFGDCYGVSGKGAGGWKIQPQAGQRIHYCGISTKAGGVVTSEHYGAHIELMCITANTDFKITNVVGRVDMENV